MDEKNRLLKKACEIFEKKIFQNLINNGLKKHSKLSSYDINPFLFYYLSNFGFGNSDPLSLAKSLMYPRILGTSVSTSFGQNVQNMVVDIFSNVRGSVGGGLDIEFEDKVDGRYKYCQLKAGPNTINKKDVKPIIDELQGGYRLLRQNGDRDVRIEDIFVGVLYGEYDSLSTHYKNIENRFPVLIGEDLWYRISGYEDFYNCLIKSLTNLANNHNAKSKLDEACQNLAKQIEKIKI